MPRLEEFCVFRATMELIKERGMQDLLKRVYDSCKLELLKPKEMMRNCVRDVYKPFSID